ncbi:MAG: MFS transporter [Gemmatimonadetes bacterium]|nr:MFS transporter [Gemmatimonadota bacterium]
MLYPVLPIFLTQTLKAGGTVVGLVEGVAQATQNIVQGFSGWLSDKLRKRKPIALAGYVLGAVSKPLIGASAVWPAVLGARFLDRLGSGIRSAPRDALIAASADEEHRGKAFGLEGAGDNLGAFLGPLLAVVLLGTLHVGIRSIFYLAIIPGLLAVVLIVLVKEQAARVEAKSKLEVNFGQFPRAYWKYLVVIAVFGIGNSSNSFLILQTRDIGASLQATILIYAAFNLVAALISYPAGFLSDRLGRRNILLLSFIVFLVTYLGFAVTRHVVLIAVLFALYGLYQGIFRSVGKAFATDFVPAQMRASAVGWYSTTVGLLQLFSSVVAGVLWDRIGHAAVFVFGAASAVAGSAALVVLVPAHRREEAPP